MKNICPICNSENLNIIRNYNSESKLLRESKLTKCINCSLVFVNPMPDFNLWIQYNNDYFNVAHGGISTDKNTINFFKGIAVVRMKYILEYLIYVLQILRFKKKMQQKKIKEDKNRIRQNATH